MSLHALLASAMLSLPSAAVPADAQPQDQDAGRSDTPYMSYFNPKEWVVTMRAYVFPDGRLAGHQQFPGWTYAKFAMVLPYVESSATSWTAAGEDGRTRAALFLNGYRANDTVIPTLTVPGTGATYASLEAPGLVKFTVASAIITSTVTCVETKFDQKAAWDIPWATHPSLTPWLALDPTYDTVKAGEPDQIQLLIEKWTGGNDPKQIPPVQLAKFLTGNVLDHTRTTGSNTQSPLGASGYRIPMEKQDIPANADSDFTYVYTPRNNRGGFNVQNAAETARTKKGSEHDLANMLTAVFRRAGLPARTVIGVDNDETGDDQVKSWVEFAVVSPDTNQPLWIPVDVWELEGDGRSARNWEQPWKHFGTTDLLRNVIPVANYFHPPANYRSYHLPALFGIRANEELPDFGTQAINFEVNALPNRGGQPQRTQQTNRRRNP